MDSRTIANIADVPIGTLHMWIARGWIGSIQVGVKGKPRDYDFQMSVVIAVFSQLMTFKIGHEHAYQIASSINRDTKPGWLFISRHKISNHEPWVCLNFGSLAEIHRMVDKIMPTSFILIDLKRIVAQLRKAESQSKAKDIP